MKLIISPIEENSLKCLIKNDLEQILLNSLPEIQENELKVQVYFVEGDNINAGVCKVEEENKKYNIYIYNGVIESLKMSLEEKYMANVQEKDLLYYQFGQEDTYFRFYDDSSIKNSFMNAIAMIIMHNIFTHECGHILLGHCEKGKKNFEVANNKAGYGHQAREMLADWYGVKQSIMSFVLSFGKQSSFSMNKEEDIFLYRKILVVSFLALYCQFDLFEALNAPKSGESEFSEYVLKQRSHPHPYTRLLYCLDVAREALMDIINLYNNVDDDVSESFIMVILDSALNDLNNILKRMGGIGIWKMISIPTINEAYYQLRKQVLKRHKKRNVYVNVQMQKMSNDYLKKMREGYNLYCNTL